MRRRGALRGARTAEARADWPASPAGCASASPLPQAPGSPACGSSPSLSPESPPDCRPFCEDFGSKSCEGKRDLKGQRRSPGRAERVILKSFRYQLVSFQWIEGLTVVESVSIPAKSTRASPSPQGGAPVVGSRGRHGIRDEPSRLGRLL